LISYSSQTDYRPSKEVLASAPSKKNKAYLYRRATKRVIIKGKTPIMMVTTIIAIGDYF
jgi:hypothetical protein